MLRTATLLTLLLPSVVAAQADRAAAVYRAALPAMLGGRAPGATFVADRTARLVLPDTVVMRGGAVNERLALIDAIPAGLPEALDAASITSRAAVDAGLPDEFRVLDAGDMALLTAGDWAGLRRHHRGLRGVAQITPVVFTGDGGLALVGVDWRCGVDCRKVTVAWLRPDDSGRWVVEGTHQFPLH